MMFGDGAYMDNNDALLEYIQRYGFTPPSPSVSALEVVT
jgi:hypothetical protein